MVWATQAQHCCLPHMQAHASRAKATAGPSRVGGAARTLRKCGGWLRLRGVGRSTRSGEPIIFRDKLSGAASRAVIERTSRWPGPQSKEQVEELPVSVALRRPVPGYRPDIDGLRAVAVISVVIFHAFPGALAGGFAGVDIFFAISGYLISQHIIETLDQGRFSLVDFYVRRIKRIYPALVTVMVATLAAGIALMASGELRQLAADALASVAFVANIYFYLTRDYFSQGASASPLLHLWSLGVEEQYYIIWPVALFVLWRFASRRVATFAIAAAILLSFACSIVLSRTHAIAAFYLPFTRFWELLFGSALAWAQFHAAKRSAVPASDTVSAARLPLRDLASVVGGALIAARRGAQAPAACRVRPRCDDDGHRPVQLCDFARQRLARPFSRCELWRESGALGVHRYVQEGLPGFRAMRHARARRTSRGCLARRQSRQSLLRRPAAGIGIRGG